MGILIRKKQKIKGITICNKEYKLFQYADDTGIFMNGTENSLKNALYIFIRPVSKYSGLTPNFEKTQCIWIGSDIGRTDKLCKERKLKWTNGPFSVLGIIFSTNLELISSLNFDVKLRELQNIISQWKKRYLTILLK